MTSDDRIMGEQASSLAPFGAAVRVGQRALRDMPSRGRRARSVADSNRRTRSERGRRPPYLAVRSRSTSPVAQMARPSSAPPESTSGGSPRSATQESPYATLRTATGTGLAKASTITMPMTRKGGRRATVVLPGQPDGQAAAAPATRGRLEQSALMQARYRSPPHLRR